MTNQWTEFRGGTMCAVCGNVYEAKVDWPFPPYAPSCHGKGWLVLISPCPINQDRRTKEWRRTKGNCGSKDHHFGRGDHVEITGTLLAGERPMSAEHFHPSIQGIGLEPERQRIVPISCDGAMRTCPEGHRHCEKFSPVGSSSCDDWSDIETYEASRRISDEKEKDR